MTYTSSTELERITFVLMLSAAELITSKGRDRKSTRLNSSHSQISYAVFCLKKKKRSYHPTATHNLERPAPRLCPAIRASSAHIAAVRLSPFTYRAPIPPGLGVANHHCADA